MLDFLRRLFFGYWTTVVYWDGDLYVHEGVTRNDAFEWARAYPNGSLVSVHYRRSKNPIVQFVVGGYYV